MFSSLSGIRLVFKTLPNSNIFLCTSSEKQYCPQLIIFPTWLYVVLRLWQRPHWNISDCVPEFSTIWWSLNASRDSRSRVIFISSLAISSGVMTARCGMEMWHMRTLSRSRGFLGSYASAWHTATRIWKRTTTGSTLYRLFTSWCVALSFNVTSSFVFKASNIQYTSLNDMLLTKKYLKYEISKGVTSTKSNITKFWTFSTDLNSVRFFSWIFKQFRICFTKHQNICATLPNRIKTA